MQSNKKRILYIITKSNFGGAQRNVFELATGRSRDKYDILVAFGGHGLLSEKLEKAGIKTRTIKNFERDIHFIKEIRAGIELFYIMREFNPDVVHLHSSKAGGLQHFQSRRGHPDGAQCHAAGGQSRHFPGAG